MIAAAILMVGFFSTVGFAQEEEPGQQEETSQQQAEPSPVPDQAAPTSATTGARLVPNEPREAKVFGAYRLRLAALRPTFSDELKLYDELYGNEKTYPELHADYTFFDWFFTFGLSIRGGYYVANGNAAKAADNGETGATIANPKVAGERLILDTNAPTTLTLLPLKLLAVAQFTPFTGKYVALEAWGGIEALRFQEVRGTKEAQATTPAATGTTTPAAKADEDKGKKTNSGWKYGTVFGGAVNVLLNPIDDRSPRSLESTLGFGYCYLSPFFEVILSASDDGADFSRTVLGLGFTFESVR